MAHDVDTAIGDRPAPTEHSPIRAIVIGADGSDASERAMEWAAGLARALDARLIAVHVLTPNRELMRDFSLDTMHTWRRDLESQLRGPWVAPLRRDHLPYRCLLVEQDTPAAGLMQAAAHNGADLIVVGTKGKGRRPASMTQVLAHRAGCPVVVIPPGWKPAMPA